MTDVKPVLISSISSPQILTRRSSFTGASA